MRERRLSTEAGQIDDVLIIGAGHNGLVCACDLAAAGQRVRLLERRSMVGGACVTEELAPGFRASTASYVVSLLDPQIVQDLRLAEHGYQVLARQPSSFTPWPDGRALILGADPQRNQQQISQFSAADAAAWPRYEAWLTRVAEVLEPLMQQAPLDMLPSTGRSWLQQFRNLLRAWQLRGQLARLGDELPATMELLLGPARPILERWFESPILRATLATDAIIGADLPPSAAGTGYVLLHHVMGSAGGARGVWGYVRGGMGAITQAMAARAQQLGVKLETDAEVAAIDCLDGAAVGVRLNDGRHFRAQRVVSNATPQVTADLLAGSPALSTLQRGELARIDYSSSSAKINLALSGLPEFSSCPTQGQVGDPHRGTIHITPEINGIELAWAQARIGRICDQPIIEMTLPSAVDDSLAPPGRHIAQLFVQYLPYGLAKAADDPESVRRAVLDRCLEMIERHAPGFGQLILHAQILLPEDLETRFGLTGGNIFHGSMGLHQLFSLRPLPGWSDYRTPVQRLYLCGAGTHPGGGVSGLPGRLAAQAILADC